MSQEHSVTEKTLRDAMLIDLSQRLAAATHAQPFHCATNAWQAFVEFPDLFRDGGRLVEGWFVIETDDRVVMNEHVWCELADGRIVDPSVLLLVAETTPVFYFAGVTRTWAEAEALEGKLFPHVRFDGIHGADGLGHPEYLAARAAARGKVYALATSVQPPKGMQFLTAQDLDRVLQANAPLGEAKPPVVEGEPLNLSLSLATSRSLPARPGRCWYNAREAILRMPQQFFSADYVEGWLIGQWADALRLIEHGWIETPHAGIVDPTIVLQEVPARLEYVPGLRLCWSRLQTHTMCPLPFARYSSWREELLSYRESCQLALAKGEQLAWQTSLPLLPEPAEVTIFLGIGSVILEREKVAWDFPVPPTPSARVSALLQEMEKGAEWL